MSLDLQDLRTKVSPDAKIILSRIAEQRGLELPELAREILHKFAADHVRALEDAVRELNIMQRRLQSEGASGLIRAAEGSSR